MSNYDAMVDLLRRLAGRLDDGKLAYIRVSLAVGEHDEAGWQLIDQLEGEGIGLSEAEIALLPAARANPESPSLTGLRRLGPGDPVPEYRFEPANPSDADAAMLRKAASEPTLREIRKARRVPANDVATGAEKTVYTAVFDAEENIAAQGYLGQGIGNALVEAVADGEELPPYQAAALDAGQQIWRRTDGADG